MSASIEKDNPPQNTAPEPTTDLERDLLTLTENPEVIATIVGDASIKTLRDAAVGFEPDSHASLGPGLLSKEPSGSAEGLLRRQQLPFAPEHQTAAKTLLASAPAFNIATDRLESLPGIVDESRNVLEPIQRIQNVSTEPESVPLLINANFISAAQISSLPLDTFISSVPGISPSTAEQIHNNATAVTQRNEMALAAVAPGLKDDAGALAVGADTSKISEGATLDSLFSNAITTNCGDCCSVLSPSAYLVDLLEFLSKLKIPATTASNDGSDPRAKLFDRRPDIGQIQLSCANTNTEIPYIDLVNEVLESYLTSRVSQSKPGIQPINNNEGDDSAQLIAEPQNVDLEAYERLAKEVSPLGTLPFDRGLEQTRILFEKLGTSRQELLEVFATKTSGVPARVVTAEILKIPSAEYTAISGEPLDPKALGSAVVRPTYIYWGFSSQSKMLNDYTGISRVKTQFLPRTGYTYDNLVELLQTKFVNGSFPSILARAKDDSQNSLVGLWQKVKWNKVGEGRAAQWGELLAFLGIQDVDSELATDVIQAFPKLPNLAIMMTITTVPETTPPYNTPGWPATRRWPMPGFVDFISGEPEGSNVNPLATFNEYGHLISRTTRQPIGYIDASGVLRQKNTDIAYYSLPEFAPPGYFAVRYAENGPIIAKLLRDDQDPGINGEMMVLPGNEAHVSQYLTKLGPRGVAEVAGWSWNPLEATGEPDPGLLAIRTLSGQPLPAQRWRQINSFIRLQKRMGWSISETDQVCTAFGADSITAAFLEELSLVKSLQVLTNTTLLQAVVFARDIPKALYEKLFIKPSVLVGNPDFALGENGKPLFNPASTLQERYQVLAAAFNATPADILRVLVATGAEEESLSVTSLSSVYRNILLCRSLGLPLTQLSSLLSVFEADPFGSIRTTIDFITQWKALLDRYSTTPSSWEYVVAGNDQLGELKPTTAAVIQTALAMKKLQHSGTEGSDAGGDTPIISILSTAFDAIPLDIMALLYQELSFTDTVPEDTNSWFFTPSTTGEYTIYAPTTDTTRAGDTAREDPTTQNNSNQQDLTASGLTTQDSSAPDPQAKDAVSLNVPVNLVGGQTYRVRPSNPASLVMILKSGTTTSMETPIPEDSIVRMEMFLDVERIMTVLSRYNLLLSASNLPPSEYEYFLDLCRLPASTERLSWQQIQSLLQHDELRETCRSAKDLSSLLRNPTFATLDSAAIAVSEVTAWGLPMTKALISHFTGVSQESAAGSVTINVEVLSKMRVAYSVATKLGLPQPGQLLSFASPETRLSKVAAELRIIARLKVDEETWESTAAALFDPLRRASRDALVAACLQLLPNLSDADGLFEFFLIDVSMGPCLRTSRLKQAISSIQVYVQRCLLGLEIKNGVLPSHIDAKEWEWMQSYGTWRANRTVILYPENWLEPSLRDSKSEVFKALEATMAQGKFTSQELVSAYVSGMAEVADLEPVAVCDGPKKDHIFARTRMAPYKFFYRSFERATRCWSSWETMQVDIPTIQITRSIQTTPDYWTRLAVKTTIGWPKAECDKFMREYPGSLLCSGSYIQAAVLDNNDDHLVLFIPTLSERNYPLKGSGDEVYTKYYWEVGMAFSERKDGKWTARQQCSETVTTKNVFNASDANDNLRPWPPLPDPDLDDHLVRQGTFFFVPTTDWKGTQALSAYLMVPNFEAKVNISVPPGQTLPTVKPDIKPYLKAAFLGEFAYERGQLNVRRTRPGAEFDKLQENGPFPHDWMFQGKTTTTATERTRQIFDYTDVGKLAPGPLVTVDVTSFQEQPGRFMTENMESWYIRCRWLKQVIVRTVTAENSRELAFPLSNNFVDKLQDIVYGGKYQDVFNHFRFTSSATWPLSSLNYPGSVPAADRKDGTTVLHQGLGIQDISKPNVWYHELRTPIAIYNWELCVHLPMLLANNFLALQQFDQAIEAIKFVFDPTAYDPADKSVVWKFLPFRETAKNKNPLDTALMTSQDQAEINKSPFNPYAVARQRCTAFMKWFAYKYIEVMLAKGDSYFRRFTLESISLAVQCYVEAAHVYGPPPQSIMSVGKKEPQTFKGVLDAKMAWALDNSTGGWNVLVQMETLFPFRVETGWLSEKAPRVNIFGSSAGQYFCVPANPALTILKDKISDRLYKIRHCQDIDGRTRSLVLWETPLDPGALVRGAASGSALGSVIDTISSSLPNYRFKYLLNHAFEMCEEVKNLGANILKLRRRKDVELLRSLQLEQQRSVAKRMQDLHLAQLDEAEKAMVVIVGNRDAAILKMEYYLKLLGEDLSLVPKKATSFDELDYNISKPKSRSGLPLSSNEAAVMDWGFASMLISSSAGAMEGTAAILHMLPQPKTEIAPAGVGTSVKYGPEQVAKGLEAAAKWTKIIAKQAQFGADLSAQWAEIEKQTQERKLEANTCGQDITGYNCEIQVQEARIAQAELRIKNNEALLEQFVEMDEFLRTKYTNSELYSWTINSLQQLYYSSYNLALDLAAKAELAYRFERGLLTSNLIRGGYWNSSHDGLLAGEQLNQALRRLQQAHISSRAHDFEITRNVSLREVSPVALSKLRASASTGSFELPEALWDMDFPGHYHRRIKSVRVSIECGAGPNTSLNATLTLLKHRYRVDPTIGEDYAETESDPRFATQDVVPILSVAVCTGRREAGVFNLNFFDERYMPFEGAGAISKWKLELNSIIRSFDYRSISDVVLHIQYTAKRETSGDLADEATKSVLAVLAQAAETSISRGLAIVVDPRAEHPEAWSTFYESGTLRIPGAGLRASLPFYSKGAPAVIRRVRVLGEYKGTADMQLSLSVGEGNTTFTFVKVTEDEEEDQSVGGEGKVKSKLEAKDKTYKVGADEKAVDALGVQWDVEGSGDGDDDWIFTASDGPTAKRLRSLQVLIGYTVDL